ncbi:hypothetical protein ACUW9N_000401 [Staphylococcus auricularis]|nr:Uncharacterised protein [Staphylococcus auricularis]
MNIEQNHTTEQTEDILEKVKTLLNKKDEK